MFLIIILALIAIISLTIVTIVASIFGAGTILAFSDVIVCIVFIVIIIKKIISHKNDKKL